MKKGTRALTLCAIMSALTVISLFIATVWPSGQLGLAAFSSLFTAAAIIESGAPVGIYVYISSTLVGLLILPLDLPILVYAMFFGYYPVVKALIERIEARVVQWILKLIVFNAALCAVYLFLREIRYDFGEYAPGLFLICLIGSAVFVLFDYGFSKVIGLYIFRIHGKFGR